MSEPEFCLLHGYEFMEKRSANRFNEYDLCTKCEEERAVQAPADRDANAVRSPEDERTLGQVNFEVLNPYTLGAPCNPMTWDQTDRQWQERYEAAATAVRDKVMEWKTIETAPKDREILVSDARTGGGFMQVVEWDNERRPPHNWAVKDGANHHKDLFTHWMPLPSPPCVHPPLSNAGSDRAR